MKVINVTKVIEFKKKDKPKKPRVATLFMCDKRDSLNTMCMIQTDDFKKLKHLLENPEQIQLLIGVKK